MKFLTKLAFAAAMTLPAADAYAQASSATMSQWLDCVINPSELVDIGSPVAGILSEVLAERGDSVKSGQILARLQADVESANVELARVRAENEVGIESGRVRSKYYEQKRDRTRKIHKRRIVSEEALETAEVEWILAVNEMLNAEYQKRLAEAELERAKALFSLKTIRSPADGVVVQRMLGPGAFVHDEVGILTLATVDPLHVETYAPIAMFPHIDATGEAEVVPEAPFDESRRARVAVVDSVFDAASGTFGIRLNMPNPDRSIPAGIKCKVRFRLVTY